MIPNDIVQTLETSGPARKMATLRGVVDLFLRADQPHGPEAMALFDTVLGLLADSVEAAARVELAERLADHQAAPPGLMRRLARDAIPVASPVLERSPVLTDADLVAIALSLGRDHLLAIAGRQGIGETVTDVLVERGDTTVLRRAADNASARFSAPGFARMVTRSRSDETLQIALGLREDIPDVALRTLVGLAGEASRARLLAQADTRVAKLIDEAVVTAGTRLAETARVGLHAEAAEVAAVATMHSRGVLAEDDVLRFARQGQRSRAFAAMALMARLPQVIADRLFVDPDDDLLLLVCKALGFGWETTAALQAFRLSPTRRPVDPQRLRATYQQLSAETAQRVLRFLQARGNRRSPPALLQ